MTGRLGEIMRMVLGGQTEGERLNALAAFQRAMRSEGLDLHDVARRFEREARHEARADADRPFRAADAREDERLHPSDPEANRKLRELADTIEDDVWPGLASWLRDQDAQWAAIHNRHILQPQQLRFAEQMSIEALTIRPSTKQCVWLLALLDKVHVAQARPAARPRATIAGTVEPIPAPNASIKRAAPLASVRPQRPPPRPTTGTNDRLQWIRAVASAQQHASRPADQARQLPLFSDAEFRVLAIFAVMQRSWAHTRKGETTYRDRPQSAAELAQAARVSVRTVRRAIGKAERWGYLTVVCPGGQGRGRRTVHRLTIPHPRYRGVATSRALTTPPDHN